MNLDVLKSRATIWLALASTYNLVRSMKTFERRLSYKFLSIELPQLGKDIDRSLTSGHLHLSSPFKKYRNSELPEFLNELFIKVYSKDGFLRDDGFEHIRLLRTLCYMFYKTVAPIEDLVTPTTKFVDVDNSVKLDFTDEQILVLKNIINLFDLPDPYDIIGSHGSGVTADKYDLSTRRSVLRPMSSIFITYGLDHYVSYVNRSTLFSDRTTINLRSRVTFVPKDTRGPRTICMEPHERMFLQKGLMRKLYDHIESHYMTRGRINFTNQGINQALAYSSSIDRKYATLDLKDASDMVSSTLVLAVFPDHYRDALIALRSDEAVLPDGSIHRLNKYAPMGSALCFPIEAIIFAAICKTITDDYYVYGDDIIVPLDVAQLVIDKLESYGLQVNYDKSLIAGFFRESCGLDSYKGYNITPIRYRRDDLLAVTEFTNQIGDSFGLCVSNTIYHTLVNQAGMFVPSINAELSQLGVVGVITDIPNYPVFTRRRFNKNLQRYEYRFLVNVTHTAKDLDASDEYRLDDWLRVKFKPLEYDFYYDYLRNEDYNRLRSIYEDQLFPLTIPTDMFVKNKRSMLRYKWIGMVS